MQRLVVSGPVRGEETVGKGGGNIPPLDVHPKGSLEPSSEMRSPIQGSGGAAIGGAVEASSHRVPNHSPPLDSQIREALIEVFVQLRGMHPGVASTEAYSLEIVSRDPRSLLRGARRTEEVHGESAAHRLCGLRIGSGG